MVKNRRQTGLVRKVLEKGTVEKKSEEELPCLQCDKSFRGNKRLWAHKQNCHDVTSVCSECGKSFTSRKYLHCHIRDVHSGQRHTCQKCQQSCKSQHALKAHLTICGEQKARRSRRPGIQCHMCPMLLTSTFNLRKHVWSQHRILLRDSSTPQKRRRRPKVIRQPRLWSCNQCDSTFKRKNSLQKHREKHRRQDQVLVQVCGFQGCAFSCLAWPKMRSHKEEEHRGKKVFPCDKCDKSFPKLSRLVGHKTRSHSSLLLKCRGEDGDSGCGKEFMRKDVLNKHMKVCGSPVGKAWALLSYSQKKRRTKKKAAQFKADLDAMDGEERKAYIAAVLKANPEYLDSLASNPFTTEDIIEVPYNSSNLKFSFSGHTCRKTFKNSSAFAEH